MIARTHNCTIYLLLCKASHLALLSDPLSLSTPHTKAKASELGVVLEANPELMDTPDEVRAFLAVVAQTTKLMWPTKSVSMFKLLHIVVLSIASNNPCRPAGCQL